MKLFCMLFCVQDLYQHISFHSEQHKERITMSSSEDEEGNDEAIAAPANLVKTLVS